MYKYDETTGKNETVPAGHSNRNFDSRSFVGIILVALGGILIARNYGWLDYEITRYLISWQMILIVIGLFNLARRAYTPAIVLISIGLFFLIDFPDGLRENFWPALIVVVGISLILQWRRPAQRSHFPNFSKGNSKSVDAIDETAVFGGRNISVVTENFQGGKITAIFGGSTIDLRFAKPVEGCTIDVVTIFGGTKIIVPEEWNMKIDVVPIFGGFDDKRSASVISRTSTGKVVMIKGSCIFGGGEITNMP
jgi:predicted membrane protein